MKLAEFIWPGPLGGEVLSSSLSIARLYFIEINLSAGLSPAATASKKLLPPISTSSSNARRNSCQHISTDGHLLLAVAAGHNPAVKFI